MDLHRNRPGRRGTETSMTIRGKAAAIGAAIDLIWETRTDEDPAGTWGPVESAALQGFLADRGATGDEARALYETGLAAVVRHGTRIL